MSTEPKNPLFLPDDHEGNPIDRPIVDDLADVLARTVTGWGPTLGYDLAQAPEVRRVLARYRMAKAETAQPGGWNQSWPAASKPTVNIVTENLSIEQKRQLEAFVAELLRHPFVIEGVDGPDGRVFALRSADR